MRPRATLRVPPSARASPSYGGVSAPAPDPLKIAPPFGPVNPCGVPLGYASVTGPPEGARARVSGDGGGEGEEQNGHLEE